MDPRIDRRRFVTCALAGAMTMALGLQGGRVARMLGAQASAAAATHRLIIGEAMAEMVDLRPVYVRTFGTAEGPTLPGPVLTAIAGDAVALEVTNTLDQPHGFAVAGTSIRSGPIPPGATRTVEFTAPAAGTYIYLDPVDAPVNRLLGLCGVLAVLPSSGNTPYTAPTPAVRRLFDDLGGTAHFPGEPWRPERTRVWHIHTIDPRWHDIAARGGALDPARVAADNLPQYFLLNGQSGYFASHDPRSVPAGRVGQPHLIRIVNTGVTANSLHIHGNHVYVTAERGVVARDALMIDSWRVGPLDTVDWVLPFRRPPDIPGPPDAPLREVLAQELAYVDRYGVRQSPLIYPMHCHAEPSQTAAGGNYPGGLVTHWEITGDLDGVDFPPSTTTTRTRR
ncbi:MAG TPA: multicopper oxidase domain-containing protein [Miltoncostaeaceae bacterium]|nr:multicopper oxidase domain-containing protein [Miltoncostaeaceae bacterium]